MRILVAVSFLALASAAVCEPAMALRDAAHGTVTTSSEFEIVVAFGGHDQNPTDRIVTSGFCQLHWGVLSLGHDGSAVLKLEASSLTATDRWQGQFMLHDKESAALGTIPSSGPFVIEVNEMRPQRTGIVIPLHFDPDLFKRISSVRMAMECRRKDA